MRILHIPPLLSVHCRAHFRLRVPLRCSIVHSPSRTLRILVARLVSWISSAAPPSPFLHKSVYVRISLSLCRLIQSSKILPVRSVPLAYLDVTTSAVPPDFDAIATACCY